MKKILIFLLPIFLVGCMEIPYKDDTQHKEGISFEHTAFHQRLKAKALERKYQEREQKYNIRNPFKNIYYREDNVPVIYMGRLDNTNNARTILDIFYNPLREEWMPGGFLGITSGDYIYTAYPEEKYISIDNHSGRNLEEVAKSGERHVFSVTSAAHPEYEIYDNYSPTSEWYIIE